MLGGMTGTLIDTGNWTEINESRKFHPRFSPK